MENPISLYELNGLVRRNLARTMPEEYWVQAELSEAREHPNGHCYVEFVQKSAHGNGLLAKARGTIWSNVFRLLKPYFERETGQRFTAGIQVLVKVTVEFHELYGFSLTVVDIDPTYTLGDLARRRKEILKQLEEEGVLTLNKELPMPALVQRIAVISSATAAGYGDFCHQLQHNPYGLVFYPHLFPALMQGDRVGESVIDALDRVNATRDLWDVVVIIRGGGATSDLSGFDHYELAANCAQFPLPIVTGLGHERDDTVIDFVAHTRAKTPTAAAEFLIARAQQLAEETDLCRERIAGAVMRRMESEKIRLQNRLLRIPSLVMQRLGDEKYRLQVLQQRLPRAFDGRKQREEFRMERLAGRLEAALTTRLEQEKHRLQLLEQSCRSASPERILKQGYTLTLKDGHVVTDAAQLNEGDRIETRMAGGTVKSTVNKIFKDQ